MFWLVIYIFLLVMGTFCGFALIGNLGWSVSKTVLR